MAAWAAESVQVGLKLGVLSVSGTWRPTDAERRAAWELYVELVTRIAVVPLKGSEGLLREALASLYALFGISREILRRYGPELARPRPEGEYSLGELAILVLNYQLRPLLARWHPLLESWEAQRPPQLSASVHEGGWEHTNELRAELEQTRQRLVGYADLLAAAAGVPPLTAYPRPEPLAGETPRRP